MGTDVSIRKSNWVMNELVVTKWTKGINKNLTKHLKVNESVLSRE